MKYVTILMITLPVPDKFQTTKDLAYYYEQYAKILFNGETYMKHVTILMITLPVPDKFQTTKDLAYYYEQYAKILFNGEMPVCVFKIMKETGRGLAWAHLRWEGWEPNYMIRFNRRTLNGSANRAALILIHEMIHIYLYAKGAAYYKEGNRLDGSRYVGHQHGPLFQQETKRIKSLTNLDIPIIEDDFEVVALDYDQYFVLLKYKNDTMFAYIVPDKGKLKRAELDALVADVRVRTGHDLLVAVKYMKTRNSLIMFFPELTGKHTINAKKSLKAVPMFDKYAQIEHTSHLVIEHEIQGQLSVVPDWIKYITASKMLNNSIDRPFSYFCKIALHWAHEHNYVKFDTTTSDWVEKLWQLAGQTGYAMVFQMWQAYTVKQWMIDNKKYINQIIDQMEYIEEHKGHISDLQATKQDVQETTLNRIPSAELYASLMQYCLKNSLVPRKQLHKYLTFITDHLPRGFLA